jgi:hypothetical protein
MTRTDCQRSSEYAQPRKPVDKAVQHADRPLLLLIDVPGEKVAGARPADVVHATRHAATAPGQLLVSLSLRTSKARRRREDWGSSLREARATSGWDSQAYHSHYSPATSSRGRSVCLAKRGSHRSGTNTSIQEHPSTPVEKPETNERSAGTAAGLKLQHQAPSGCIRIRNKSSRHLKDAYMDGIYSGLSVVRAVQCICISSATRKLY